MDMKGKIKYYNLEDNKLILEFDSEKTITTVIFLFFISLSLCKLKRFIQTTWER